MMVNDYND